MTVKGQKNFTVFILLYQNKKTNYDTTTKLLNMLVCVCLFVSFLVCQLQGSQLGWEQPRKLDLLLPLDLHSHVLYILVRPTAELARTRVSRWYSIFILQSHSLKQKQLWTSNHTGPLQLFNDRLLLPIGMAWDLQKTNHAPGLNM